VDFHPEVFGISESRTLASDLPMFVDGEFVGSAEGAMAPLINPATGRQLGRAAEASTNDVSAAVDAAHEAFVRGTWSQRPRKERAAVLHRLADLIDEKREQIFTLETLNNGRPIRETKAQLSILGDYYRYAASVLLTHRDDVIPSDGGHHVYTLRSAMGVCAIITPFNHPMLILGQSLPFALAAGNSVVVKPSELTPVTTVFLAALAVEAGLPPGVFNVVTGAASVASALVADERVAKVNFTGGAGGGRAMVELTAGRPVKLTTELGGHSPVVVFEDADLDAAVCGVTFASFIASGQTCVAASRVLVQSSIYDQFLAELVAKARTLRLGDPTSAETDVGPVISADRREALLRAMARAEESGAVVISGGKAAVQVDDSTEGFFLEPAVVADVHPTMPIASEEVFGPFVVVMRFDDEQDAIELANRSRFALGAAVWTRDVGRAHRVAQAIESGICWVNDHHRLEVSVPWGGHRASGVGKEAGLEAFADFTNQRVVIVNNALQSSDWYGAGETRLN
jgi:acyl-CoA reductase-like NAD-dependent aldehyde dehydrogenase